MRRKDLRGKKNMEERKDGDGTAGREVGQGRRGEKEGLDGMVKRKRGEVRRTHKEKKRKMGGWKI